MDPTLDTLKSILQELKKIRDEEQLYKLDDNVLFDSGVRIYNSLLINQQKSARADQPMSDRQRRLLENLHYTGNMELTKAQATDIIRRLLDSRE